MELWITNKNLNISKVATDIITEGDYRNVCRTLDFGIPLVQSDERTHGTTIEKGDTIQLTHNNVNLFSGIVWQIPQSTVGKELSVHCKGYGIYLKNEKFYKFNCMPEKAVEQIASDFNIELGHIEKTGVTVKRNFFGNSLYEIIMTMYNLANERKYMVLFDLNKLLIIEKGISISKPIKNGSNLLNLAYTDTLQDMTNKVFVYNKDNVLIDTLSDNNSIIKYGIFSKYLKTDEAYKSKANKLLKGESQTITVNVLGDTSYAVGKCVMLEEPYTKVKGKFYIDTDSHIFKNGQYTCKLTLNYKNLMDEKEVGSYEQAYQDKVNKEQGEKLIFHKWLGEDKNVNNKVSGVYHEIN